MKSSTIDIVFLTLEPKNYRDQVVTESFEYKYLLPGTVDYLIGDQTYTCMKVIPCFLTDGLSTCP